MVSASVAIHETEARYLRTIGNGAGISANRANSLLREADQQLEWLIDPMSKAIEDRSCIVLVQAWRKTPYLALLPFHLHLRWPGRIDALPLNPRIGVVPFFESDFFTVSTPLYEVSEVVARRASARVSRASGRSFSDDFAPQDWESGVLKRLSRLGRLVLPGVSYVAIDRVSPEGEDTPGHRPLLGRIAARAGPRPCVLTPTKRGLSVKSACAFGQLHVLLMNAQGLRGYRTISSLRTLLGRCVGQMPILILASNPTDVLVLFEEGIAECVRLQFVGDVRRSIQAAITVVGRDRPSADREFEFATEGLEQRGHLPVWQGHVMIKRDHHKYQCYGPDMPEVLFDLQANPQETVNYIADPAYANEVAAFRRRLAALGHGPQADPHYVNAGYR